MNDDTINRKEAINAVLRNLNEEEYQSSWESGAVKVMKDTLEKMPTEDRPVNGVLFKGRLKEGDYTLIKTTDGWVLKGKTSYVGFNFAYRTQGYWTKTDVATYRCSECGKIQIADDVNELNYCCCCGSKNKVRRLKGADDERV